MSFCQGHPDNLRSATMLLPAFPTSSHKPEGHTVSCFHTSKLGTSGSRPQVKQEAPSTLTNNIPVTMSTQNLQEVKAHHLGISILHPSVMIKAPSHHFLICHHIFLEDHKSKTRRFNKTSIRTAASTLFLCGQSCSELASTALQYPQLMPPLSQLATTWQNLLVKWGTSSGFI